MKRLYYISDNLDDLDKLEQKLERSGVVTPQIHVLSNDDSGVDNHPHLHNIESVLKQDVVHGTILGAIVGALAAALVLAIAQVTALPETYTWMPFYFLAIVMFGFITWSGGFYGIQTPHKDFKRFQKDLDNGKHIFIVDVDPSQEDIVRQLGTEHPHLIQAGTGEATPRWIVMGQQNVKKFTSTTFP